MLDENFGQIINLCMLSIMTYAKHLSRWQNICRVQFGDKPPEPFILNQGEWLAIFNNHIHQGIIQFFLPGTYRVNNKNKIKLTV